MCLLLQPLDLLQTSKQKADHIKHEIREKMTDMLGLFLTFLLLMISPPIHLYIVEIMGNTSATMQYANYKEAIVQRYGIELQGWTYNKLINLSELSTSVPPLQKLLDAIKTRDCKFIKLTPDEHHAHLETYKKKIADGEIKICKRKM